MGDFRHKRQLPLRFLVSPALHVWKMPPSDNQLDGRSSSEVSKLQNLREKGRLQISLLSLPPKLANSLQDGNPNQRAYVSLHESPTDLWRLTLSKLLVLDVGNHVQPCHSYSTQRRVGPNDSLWQKPTLSPTSEMIGRRHPLQRRPRVDRRHRR